MEDKRNVIDKFKGIAEVDIIKQLDKNGVDLEIAIENLERDFNMGTIIRTANAFGVRQIHIIGRRQWNKRGAMMTDKYLHINYYHLNDFLRNFDNRPLIAIDNIEGAESLNGTVLPHDAILVFGSESSGISEHLLDACSKVVEIEQFGSTRSINVASAAGIAMYEWLKQHKLK